MSVTETASPSPTTSRTIDRSALKHGYKLAASVLWEANERLVRDVSRKAPRDSIIARRQAGRVMMAIGAEPVHFETTMMKYERNLMDFLYI